MGVSAPSLHRESTDSLINCTHIFIMTFHNKNYTHIFIMTFHNKNEMEVQRSKVNFDVHAVDTFVHG